jgi:hypothetical protein
MVTTLPGCVVHPHSLLRFWPNTLADSQETTTRYLCDEFRPPLADEQPWLPVHRRLSAAVPTRDGRP